MRGDSHVVSCGSADLTVMQWKVSYDVDKLKPMKDAMTKFRVSNAFSGAKGLIEKEKKGTLGLAKEGAGSKLLGAASKLLGDKK